MYKSGNSISLIVIICLVLGGAYLIERNYGSNKGDVFASPNSTNTTHGVAIKSSFFNKYTSNIILVSIKGSRYSAKVDNISVIVIEDLDGTYADIEWNLTPFYIEQPATKVLLKVRTNSQKKEWDDFLQRINDDLYKPRDVMPPKAP